MLIAAYHVFRRLLVPRHPPCALIRLTYRCIALQLRLVLIVFTIFVLRINLILSSDVLNILRLLLFRSLRYI